MAIQKNAAQVIRESILNGLPVTPAGLELSNVKVNYFKRADPKNWYSDNNTYNRISLGDIYQNIELRLMAHGNNIEKLFHVRPGAFALSSELAAGEYHGDMKYQEVLVKKGLLQKPDLTK